MAEKCKHLLDWDDIQYLMVFGVAGYDSELKIKKFKMAVLICRTMMQKAT